MGQRRGMASPFIQEHAAHGMGHIAGGRPIIQSSQQVNVSIGKRCHVFQ
jgi:hypothetical protein